jgi:transcriptional regulator with XRE-family HTH domain
MPQPRQADSHDRAMGFRVRSLRVARRMTQADLGRALGVSFQQVQKYENGSNRISAGRLQRIARIFDVPPTALFGSVRQRRNGAAEPLAALRTIGAARLLQAYGGIRNAAVRRAFVRLAEELAARGR